jgi:hypothetical protein
MYLNHFFPLVLSVPQAFAGLKVSISSELENRLSLGPSYCLVPRGLLCQSVQFCAAANRALVGMSGSATRVPTVVAVCAGEPPLIVSHLIVAALQQNRLPLDNGFRHDLPGLLYDPTEGGSGNPHPHTGFLLRQSFQISQAHGFHLIDGQPHLLHLPQRDSARLEIADRWITGDDAIFLWSGQSSLHFDHILNIHSILIKSRPADVNSSPLNIHPATLNALGPARFFCTDPHKKTPVCDPRHRRVDPKGRP